MMAGKGRPWLYKPPSPSKQVVGSVRSRKKYAALVKLCVNLLLNSESRTTGEFYKTPTIKVKWMKYYVNKPEWWTCIARELEKLEDCYIATYTAESMLQMFYDNKLSDQSPADVFRSRLPLKMQLVRFEEQLDKMLDWEYNVDIE